MTSLLTQADEAIQIYEQHKNNLDYSKEASSKYPYWEDIFKKVTELWQSKYEQQIIICSDKIFAQGIILKFRTDLKKIFGKKPDYSNLKKYYNHLIDYQVDYIATQLMSMLNHDDQKENRRRSGRNMKINLDNFEAKKLEIQSVDKVSQELEKLKTEISQPEVMHMIRAHSKMNDPNDNSSEVNEAAFELAGLRTSLDEAQKYTNLVATCGQYIVNFIDTQTGKIIKRFNDDHMNQKSVREVYCRLAWTILNNKSILVAGGKHGQIKVIMPHKNVCISRFDAHSARINVLMFHWRHPDILLSASDDYISIWRIKIIDSEETVECECNYELINRIEYKTKEGKEKVLSLCFVPNDYLLISTEFGCYSVCLNDEELFKETNVNTPDERDISTYLTTYVEHKKASLKANFLDIYNQTESKSGEYQDNIISNKLFYVEDSILAPVVDSYSIYRLKICQDSTSKLQLRVISIIDMKTHVNYRNDLNTNMTFYQDAERINLFQPAKDGLFYSIKFNSKLTKYKLIFKLKLPANYSITNKKENLNIPVDNYNLCDLPTVLNCVCNGEKMVSTYDQNIILIWKD